MPLDAQSLKVLYRSQTYRDDTAAWTKVVDYLGSKEFESHARGIEPYYQLMPSELAAHPVDQLTLKRTLVQHHAELLNTVHELSGHRQPVQFDIGFDLTSSRDNQMRLQMLIAGLLTWEMEVAIADKDSVKAFQALIAQLDTVSIAQGEHMTVNHQTYATEKIAIFKNVKRLVQSNFLSQQQMESVVAHLQTLPSDIQDWQLNVQAERAYWAPILQRPLSDADRPPILPPEITTATAKDFAHFLTYMDRYESINWASWKSAKQSLERIDADMQRESRLGMFSDERNWRNTLFFANHTPVLSKTGWSHHAQYLALCRSEQYQSIVACGLRLYLIKHGSFPKSLSQLVDVGIDPNNYLSMADLPFGYECKNNIAYLWGPIEDERSQFPFEIIPYRPQPSMNPDETARINHALWTLEP